MTRSEFRELLAQAAFTSDGHVTHGSLEEMMKLVDRLIEYAYKHARGTKNLENPTFTRSQAYWRGRADAANVVRTLLPK